MPSSQMYKNPALCTFLFLASSGMYQRHNTVDTFWALKCRHCYVNDNIVLPRSTCPAIQLPTMKFYS